MCPKLLEVGYLVEVDHWKHAFEQYIFSPILYSPDFPWLLAMKSITLFHHVLLAIMFVLSHPSLIEIGQVTVITNLVCKVNLL